MTQKRKLHRAVRAALVPVVGVCLAAPAWAGGDARSAAPAPGAQAPAQQAGQQQQAAAQEMRASSLMGTDVHNLQGEQLGEISDIVVDVSSGEAPYALIAYDRGMLRGDRYVAVPLDELRIAEGGERISIDATGPSLEQRAVERDQWRSALGGEHRENFQAFRSSDLIGTDVQNREGDNIGEINDLVVDLGEKKVRHVVLEIDEGLLTQDRHVAVPIDALAPAEGDRLALNVSEQDLRGMPAVEPSSATGAGMRLPGTR